MHVVHGKLPELNSATAIAQSTVKATTKRCGPGRVGGRAAESTVAQCPRRQRPTLLHRRHQCSGGRPVYGDGGADEEMRAGNSWGQGGGVQGAHGDSGGDGFDRRRGRFCHAASCRHPCQDLSLAASRRLQVGRPRRRHIGPPPRLILDVLPIFMAAGEGAGYEKRAAALVGGDGLARFLAVPFFCRL